MDREQSKSPSLSTGLRRKECGSMAATWPGGGGTEGSCVQYRAMQLTKLMACTKGKLSDDLEAEC
jgi:hypothetical protein